jgi:hypothetical protein
VNQCITSEQTSHRDVQALPRKPQLQLALTTTESPAKVLQTAVLGKSQAWHGTCRTFLQQKQVPLTVHHTMASWYFAGDKHTDTHTHSQHLQLQRQSSRHFHAPHTTALLATAAHLSQAHTVKCKLKCCHSISQKSPTLAVKHSSRQTAIVWQPQH